MLRNITRLAGGGPGVSRLDQPCCIVTRTISALKDHYVGAHALSPVLGLRRPGGTYDYLAMPETTPLTAQARSALSLVRGGGFSVHQLIFPPAWAPAHKLVGCHLVADIDMALAPPSTTTAAPMEAAMAELGVNSKWQSPASGSQLVADVLTALDVALRHVKQPGLSEQRVLVVDASGPVEGRTKHSYHIYAHSKTGGFANSDALRHLLDLANTVIGIPVLDRTICRSGGSLRLPFSPKHDGTRFRPVPFVPDTSALTPAQAMTCKWLDWYLDWSEEEILAFALESRFMTEPSRLLYHAPVVSHTAASTRRTTDDDSVEKWDMPRLKSAVEALPDAVAEPYQSWHLIMWLLSSFAVVHPTHAVHCRQLGHQFSSRCPAKYVPAATDRYFDRPPVARPEGVTWLLRGAALRVRHKTALHTPPLRAEHRATASDVSMSSNEWTL